MSFNSKRCHSDYRRVEQSPKASTKPSAFPCDTASASTETASMPESNGHQTTKHQTHILAYNPIFRPTPRNTAKEQKSS
ncbi:hypothetical protein FKX99_00610 [Bifidobacterium longum subsp. longum]|nr:hypothetical protein [Bifidobacterium longum subsp. longum]